VHTYICGETLEQLNVCVYVCTILDLVNFFILLVAFKKAVWWWLLKKPFGGDFQKSHLHSKQGGSINSQWLPH